MACKFGDALTKASPSGSAIKRSEAQWQVQRSSRRSFPQTALAVDGPTRVQGQARAASGRGYNGDTTGMQWELEMRVG